MTSGARENEVVFADDQGMPWELGRERKTSGRHCVVKELNR